MQKEHREIFTIVRHLTAGVKDPALRGRLSKMLVRVLKEEPSEQFPTLYEDAQEERLLKRRN